MQLTHSEDYKKWISELKISFKQQQLKAAVSVNTALLEFYWQLGKEIIEKQQSSQWGDGFLKQLSQDLMHEFPNVKGFSKRNLELIRKWYCYWQQDTAIAKQAVSQLVKIPWGHNLAIISKANSTAEAMFYVMGTMQHGWSRSVLLYQIASDLYQRDGQTINNFQQTLPPAQSDLARQSVKDPYVFDFLTLTADYNERELEQGLIAHITQFLLELGAGFAYMGKQVPIKVGENDYYLDLLFYHTQLHCYVVIELKVTDFAPEHAGKLNFYLNAVDTKYKQTSDQPSIGILLCRNKDKLVAEYALKGIDKPIGISEYQLTQALPENLKPSLPSIEELEIELAKELGLEQGLDGGDNAAK
ncbi:PDDEXK nuclease domain-containing protein [Pseudoalteromonas luteoviolacea]|uniref:PDDEXK nuclease domain-containing protein n=1 Tax=Pseudoalteromonas luteoviolacea TaxID=43657 RepID=UPI001F480EB1|nr:PDDEXK nuclease domain-containing protein [Pseudoalteromonas luteoviolacea]MCF6439856.1 PDDEXK nuclease domain-containing protein [Pseudoalteromonas luteoviolacea]